MILVEVEFWVIFGCFFMFLVLLDCGKHSTVGGEGGVLAPSAASSPKRIKNQVLKFL